MRGLLFQLTLSSPFSHTWGKESWTMATVSGSSAVPSRYHYMIYLLATLKAFGGSSTSKEVYQWFTERGIARPDDLADTQRSGETRFAKEVRFARQLLFYGGLIAADAGG